MKNDILKIKKKKSFKKVFLESNKELFNALFGILLACCMFGFVYICGIGLTTCLKYNLNLFLTFFVGIPTAAFLLTCSMAILGILGCIILFIKKQIKLRYLCYLPITKQDIEKLNIKTFSEFTHVIYEIITVNIFSLRSQNKISADDINDMKKICIEILSSNQEEINYIRNFFDKYKTDIHGGVENCWRDLEKT